jgi:predicted nucleotidyltransferase
VSRPRTLSFDAGQRSRLARRAATARWARLGRGVLTLAEIRTAVVKALAGREAKAAAGGAEVPDRSIFVPPAPGERVVKNPRVKAAWLFGSYARGDATARSDLDIMVIVEEMPRDWPGESVDLTSAIHEALGEGVDKEIDLLLADEATFEDYKEACNSVYHDVHKEGIRLA